MPPVIRRDPENDLHVAAKDGSVERTLAILSNSRIDIDQGSPQGITPLMFASAEGHAPVVRILLSKQANMSIVDDLGRTALTFASGKGHVDVTEMLLRAGADVAAGSSYGGFTPLRLATELGDTDVMKVLIEAGAHVDGRETDGAYALFTAACNGHVAAVRELLHAKSNPLWTTQDSAGHHFSPLEIAAERGHAGVVRELLQKVGTEGCGGASGGYRALWLAAQRQHVDIMRILTDAGVADTGEVLKSAAGAGWEASVKFLVQELARKSGDGGGYLNYCDDMGATPILVSIMVCHPRSPRIVQLLIDAGADTTWTIPIPIGPQDEPHAGNLLHLTPLGVTTFALREKIILGRGATKEELHTMLAICRLLMREEALHAVSWLWPRRIPAVTDPAKDSTRAKTAPMTSATPLRIVLPILRGRTERRVVLLAALFRYSSKLASSDR